MNSQAFQPFMDPDSLYVSNPLVAKDPELRGLNMLMGFTGYSDAGHVVAQIAEEFGSKLEPEPVMVFDVDQLIDYRSRRPQISFVEDHLEDYRQPRLAVYRLQDGLGKPFLFLTGNEPDLQWERFAAAVISVVKSLEVNLVAWVHAVPMPVPHTRPIGVTVHGNRSELSEGVSSWRGNVQLPAGVGHLVEVRLAEAGINVVGYALHVPHYLADAEYPAVAVAALEYLGAATSLMLPTDRLREAGREVERNVTDQVSDSTEIQQVVTDLEQQYDERAENLPVRSLLTSDDELPSADALAASIEAYLAQQPQQEEPSDGPESASE